jgi:hypothetical protein
MEIAVSEVHRRELAGSLAGKVERSLYDNMARQE